jgi:hypothetical protein
MGNVIQAGNRMNPARQAAPLGERGDGLSFAKTPSGGKRLIFQL